MNNHKLIGGVLLIASVAVYIFQPFESDFFDFLSGAAVAIGLRKIKSQ